MEISEFTTSALKKQLDEHLREGIQGEFAIGLLGFAAIGENLEMLSTKPDFGLIASCTTRLETMGDKIYQARDRVLKYFDDKPFIVFYVGGESTYSPEKGLNYVNMSFNSAVFFSKNS